MWLFNYLWDQFLNPGSSQDKIDNDSVFQRWAWPRSRTVEANALADGWPPDDLRVQTFDLEFATLRSSGF